MHIPLRLWDPKDLLFRVGAFRSHPHVSSRRRRYYTLWTPLPQRCRSTRTAGIWAAIMVLCMTLLLSPLRADRRQDTSFLRYVTHGLVPLIYNQGQHLFVRYGAVRTWAGAESQVIKRGWSWSIRHWRLVLSLYHHVHYVQCDGWSVIYPPSTRFPCFQCSLRGLQYA